MAMSAQRKSKNASDARCVVPNRAERVEPFYVGIQSRFQRFVEQMLYAERFREIGAAGFALTGSSLQVDLPSLDCGFVAAVRWHVRVCAFDVFHCQVVAGERQLRFQQPFIDGAELAH